MFYLNKDKELTPDLLNKMINRFRNEVQPKLQKYKDYYDGNQKILSKYYADASKPCSRVVTNYCKNIVDSYNGYLASPEYISYNSEQDITEIMNILKYNDYTAEDSAFLADALIYGVANELMYTDEAAKVRFRLINPLNCFAVFDDTLTGDLLYFIRMYKADEWEDTNTYNVDLYTDTEIKHYKMFGANGYPEFINSERHYFSQCPANVFYMPDEKSVFDCIMNLQDSYNETLSSEIDDFSAFCDAYLTLTGADIKDEDIATMKENRVLVLPEGALASWLTKNASDTQVENTLKRIHENIYRVAQCPDFSSESFVGGVSSGIAIRYRLTGMETRAAKIAAQMKKALQRRIEIIVGIASLKLGEEMFRDITITFKRNIPSDNTELLNLVKGLEGVCSKATLLSQLPFVSDVQKEIEQINKETEEQLAMYDFGESTDNEEE